MAENYVTNQYSFESRESYEQTKKEAEQIKKLIHSADLKNPKIKRLTQALKSSAQPFSPILS